jgi:acyl-CoA synthetase (AMP-forming)/AMP-acid ligase II
MIVDDEMKPLAEGETGQLALRGPGMFSGYLNPPRSREEVLHDGWFLTGDLAHRDSGGRIVLDGRTSSVIHVAGHKVFPEEVAAVLDQHPAVLRSRVFAARIRNGRGDFCGSAIAQRATRPTASEDHRLLPPPAFEPESAGLAGIRRGNQHDLQRQSPARLGIILAAVPEEKEEPESGFEI